jgi:hypothetical protein
MLWQGFDRFWSCNFPQYWRKTDAPVEMLHLIADILGERFIYQLSAIKLAWPVIRLNYDKLLQIIC